LSPEDFNNRLLPFLPKSWQKDKRLNEILPLIQSRLTTLKDAENYLKLFFEAPEKVRDLNSDFLNSSLSVLESVAWNKEAIEAGLVGEVAKNNFNKSDFFMNLRLAIAGQKITPPLTESMIILGQEEVVKRLKNSLK
jgi:glutamyl-tRNA synthetase